MQTRLLIVALLLAAAPAAGDEFTVLSYNTHGLSAWVAGDDPAARLSIIGVKSNAYHVALLRGCDVDQPRNLAKSVTVE